VPEVIGRSDDESSRAERVGLVAAAQVHPQLGRLRNLGYQLHADVESILLVFIGLPLFFIGLAVMEVGLKGWR
jgi:hypothetical protein